MTISKKIIKYLEDKKYKYEICPHKTVYTAWDKSQTKKVKPQEVAKSLVLKADKDYVLALVPSNRLLDVKKLLKFANEKRKKNGGKAYKKLNLAREAWMKKNILGRVGATPPFQELLKMEIFMDKLLAKNKKVYVGSGEYTDSIKIDTKQYLKLENMATGNFSKKK